MSKAMLQADEIRRLLPHAGSMCLIEHVVAHDDAHIACTTSSHRDGDNPLRTVDGLAAVHAIEYGAQTMALHGLLRGKTGRVCAVVSAREVEFCVDRLNEMVQPLLIAATVVAESGIAASYRFTVRADNRLLVSGRLTVAFLGATSE